jgi:hypothetical protein
MECPVNIPANPELDTVSPELLAMLKAERSGTRSDVLSGAEKAAVERAAKARGLRPHQVRASLRRAIRQQIERLKKQIDRHNKQRIFLEPPAPKYYGPPVRIGFDAEWVTLPDGGDGYRNEILCIAAVVECGGRYTRHMHIPKGPMHADRPTMAGFFQGVIRAALKEGTIPSMPDAITAFAHFMRGDLSSFSDFWAHKREFRGLGKTLASGRAGHVLELGDDSAGGNISDAAPPDPSDDPDAGGWARSQAGHFRALDGRRFRVKIRFIDTIKLTPGQKGLAYVGAMNGRLKLDLHKDLGIPETGAHERPECVGLGLPARYGKDRMDLVWRDFPEQMKAYAFEDAEITLDHGIKMEKLAHEEFGLQRLPNTLAGCSAGIIRNLSGGGAALDEIVGRATEVQQRFDEKTRRYRTVKHAVPKAGLAIYYDLATRCYHGGRNECFYHGPTDDHMWYDFDLPGAYTTALVHLRPIDYDNIRQELDPDAYEVGDMGVAWIEFEFPAGTKYPCLPVRGERGALLFPMRGRKTDNVFVGSPEIFLARRMGARIKIVQGFKAPWKSEHRIFEAFTKLVQSKRREFPRSTHRAINELWKEVGNAGYGLLAQGLKGKQAFDPATMESQPIGPSPLTEPFLAAWATSFIRAVLGELLARVPDWGTVVTATTDGLLTDVPLNQLGLDGPLCTFFADIRERLFGDRTVVELKHGARQLISVAVRATFTARKAEGYELVCAKGSVKPPTRPDPTVQNQHMVRLFYGLRPGMTTSHEQLISAREQFRNEADLYGISRVRRLNLRYDFKRRPVQPRLVRLGRTRRIAWDTVPWETVEQADYARVRVDGWSRDRSKVFRTMEDYRDWEAYFEASWAVKETCEAADVRTVQIRKDNAWGVLKRFFLQAGRQGAWGVVFKARGLRSVADILTAAGFPTGKEDITYAGRRDVPPLEHCVPWVPETRALLCVILRHFPEFDYRRAFRPAEAPVLEAGAAICPDEIASWARNVGPHR